MDSCFFASCGCFKHFCIFQAASLLHIKWCKKVTPTCTCTCMRVYIYIYIYLYLFSPTADCEASLRRAASGETLVEAPSDTDVQTFQNTPPLVHVRTLFFFSSLFLLHPPLVHLCQLLFWILHVIYLQLIPYVSFPVSHQFGHSRIPSRGF